MQITEISPKGAVNPPRIAAINASAPIAACVSLTPSSRAIDWRDELTGTALLVVALCAGLRRWRR